ncbi:hypothetical protein [Paenibacillus graminis]|uniref:Alkyl hydroperoxide reductase subunit C/ Thiol specific antioxidant domain-containing protein n=1 Tax=Paenibacillus graminis TaxID=189425 RepID=A0A089MGB1_9BACL|nr:hypothetical protein [Paenibacillus graminis]AIQ70538.1 hypothetical protein PGRAT_25055 [Paenibacillus graminis]
MSLFEQLFKDSHPTAPDIPFFKKGDLFPDPIKSEFRPQIVLFLSLICKDCIDIIVYLHNEAVNQQIIRKNLELFVVGKSEEVVELKEYLGDKYMIKSITPQELALTYRIINTPFLYHIYTDNRILKSYEFFTLEHFITEAFDLSYIEEAVP